VEGFEEMKVEFDLAMPFSNAAIVFTCVPGADLYACKMQAAAIAAKTLCEVSFTHNEREFVVLPEDIYDMVKQQDK
jgi:hypothetical protein